LNDDRGFLKNQSKDAMKQNKILQVAYEKTRDTNQALKEFLDRNKPKIKALPAMPQQASIETGPNAQESHQSQPFLAGPFITQTGPMLDAAVNSR
jgi:hypothetical protein